MPHSLINGKITASIQAVSGPIRGNVMESCLSHISFKIEPKYEGKVVRIRNGLVEGFSLKTVDGVSCDVFLGIPYAKPPVGELRFQKPQPAEDWEGIRKCTKNPNRGVQKEMPWELVLPRAPTSENCLFINVYAPRIKEDTKYPVLFYIHGGGWMMDSAERYTPKNICRLLVSKACVVVTFHYRLGFSGFLCTGDDVCPGNFGLYDMLEALKWTHANIASFGGDPESITLSGQSAGGVAADLLSISPLAKGLFKRKIVMGGNSYCNWATTNHDDIRDYCRRKALKLGWKPSEYYISQREESQDILDFYKSLPCSRLGTTMWFSKTIFTACVLPLAPVIDGELIPENWRFLRETQESVPSMVGGGEYEALLFYGMGLFKGCDKEVDTAIELIAKKSGLSMERVERITKIVYGDCPELRANDALRKLLFVEIVSDIFVNFGNYCLMKDAQKKGVECYGYSFDYQSKQLWGWLHHVVPFTAGTHTSDVTYLFDANYMSAPLGMTKKDKQISEMTAELWTNFVKFGSPNGPSDDGRLVNMARWEPVAQDQDNIRVFSIKENPQMEVKSWASRMQHFELLVGGLYEGKVKRLTN